MTTASLPLQGRELALELHELLRQLDPASWRPELELRIRSRLDELRGHIERLIGTLDSAGPFAALREALEHARDIVADTLPADALGTKEAKRQWKAFRDRLLAAYEDLSASLEAWDIHVPSLRPTNYARNVLHVFWAASAAGTLAIWPERAVVLPIIIGFFTWAWSMEFLRRYSKRLNDLLMWALGRFAHPHEWYRVNSATWYATALFVLAWLDALTAGMVAIVVLGLGDPTAAIIGRRFGRTRLVHGRTLEGTAAFVAFATLGTWGVLTFTHPELGVLGAFMVAFAGATAGSLAELFSRRIDDNLTIPLASAAAAAVVLGMMGFHA